MQVGVADAEAGEVPQVGLVEAESSRQRTEGVLVGHMVRLPAWVHQNAQNHVRSGGHHAHFEVDARSLLGGRSLVFFPRKNFEVVAAWSFSPGKHFEVVAGLTQPPSFLLLSLDGSCQSLGSGQGRRC